jgi:hypothetical protein
LGLGLFIRFLNRFLLGIWRLRVRIYFVFRQNGRNSFKNGRMRAVQLPPPILAQFHPIWAKFDQFGKQSANFGVRSVKIVCENSNARTTVLKQISAILAKNEIIVLFLFSVKMAEICF